LHENLFNNENQRQWNAEKSVQVDKDGYKQKDKQFEKGLDPHLSAFSACTAFYSVFIL